MATEISLLLGAGFSVNKGYPTANELNEKILNLDPEDFIYFTDGTVFIKDREKPDHHSLYNIKYKFFLTRLIKYFYEQSGMFNYEDFYDFYTNLREDSTNESFNNFCNTYRNEYHDDTNNLNLLSQTNIIFSQIVSIFLVDAEGRRFYDSVHYSKPIYPGYTGFLNCLESWGSNNTVHIHTLNHDIFFETFKHSDWLQGKLSDGFSELGSPFYGDLAGGYKIRLPYFTDNHFENYRLYKLHGSFDQFPFHHVTDSGRIDTYIKTKLGVGTSNLYKEVTNNEGQLEYINDWINYHPDFLTGTTSKILRYREPWYYNKIFTCFENNLINSNALIIIGYGCRDTEINKIIGDKFDYGSKPIYVIDPYPSEDTSNFCEMFNATLIQKTPDNINNVDFN